MQIDFELRLTKEEWEGVVQASIKEAKYSIEYHTRELEKDGVFYEYHVEGKEEAEMVLASLLRGEEDFVTVDELLPTWDAADGRQDEAIRGMKVSLPYRDGNYRFRVFVEGREITHLFRERK